MLQNTQRQILIQGDVLKARKVIGHILQCWGVITDKEMPIFCFTLCFLSFSMRITELANNMVIHSSQKLLISLLPHLRPTSICSSS